MGCTTNGSGTGMTAGGQGYRLEHAAAGRPCGVLLRCRSELPGDAPRLHLPLLPLPRRLPAV